MYKIKVGFHPLDEKLVISRAGQRRVPRLPKRPIRPKHKVYAGIDPSKLFIDDGSKIIKPHNTHNHRGISTSISPTETATLVFASISTIAAVGAYYHASAGTKARQEQRCSHKHPASRRVCRKLVNHTRIVIIDGKEYLASYCSAGHEQMVRVTKSSESKKAERSQKDEEG
tara:strand:+ start:75 stop:587 length:513 start_codon:yes stop_codon:yes gene_type:complete